MTYIVIEQYEYDEDTSFKVFRTLDEARKYVATIDPERYDDLIGVHLAELHTSIKVRDQRYSICDQIEELAKEGKE